MLHKFSVSALYSRIIRHATLNLGFQEFSKNFPFLIVFFFFSVSIETMHPVIISVNVPVVWYKLEPLETTIGSFIQTLPGTQVSLNCRATGIPLPKITWRWEGERLLQTGISLKLDAVELKNSGQYTCVATNIAGSAEANSNITIQGTLKRN